MTNERDIERAFVSAGKAHGALALKLTSPGMAGVPDRLVLLPEGRTSFVELKAPGRKPRPLQLSVFRRFAALGHPVVVIDSIEAAKAFWEREVGA